MTKFFGGQEVFDQNDYANSMRRAGRIMSGHLPYLLMNEVSDQTASALADYAGLTGNDRNNEEKLSFALNDMLKTIIQARDEAVSAYPEEDWPILTTVAARSLKQSLADAIRSTVEQADAQLAELRREANAA